MHINGKQTHLLKGFDHVIVETVEVIKSGIVGAKGLMDQCPETQNVVVRVYNVTDKDITLHAGLILAKVTAVWQPPENLNSTQPSVNVATLHTEPTKEESIEAFLLRFSLTKVP